MFRYHIWAVGNYRSGPAAAKIVGTESTGGFHQQDVSPCSYLGKCIKFRGFLTSIGDAGFKLLGVFRGGGPLGDVLLDVTLQGHRDAVLVFL